MRSHTWALQEASKSRRRCKERVAGGATRHGGARVALHRVRQNCGTDRHARLLHDGKPVSLTTAFSPPVPFSPERQWLIGDYDRGQAAASEGEVGPHARELVGEERGRAMGGEVERRTPRAGELGARETGKGAWLRQSTVGP